MRDYTLTMIYNKNNKLMFQHEHIIYISDYVIRKLKYSTHWHIDGTFVYPKGLCQLIVILYYDERLQKRFPGLFALTNNKKEKGYEFLFNKIYDMIAVNNTINLNSKSYTVDFESGLINATKKILQKIRCIGCYYHYTRAIKEEAREMKLLTPDKYEKN